MASKPVKQENPWVNILFNIIIPVIILNQLSRRLEENGPAIALVVALAFPIGYGIYDYITRKKKNWLSLLGIVNVSLSGGMGLLQLEGIWFAVKEALFPLIIGVAVFASAYTRLPFMRLLAMNDTIMDVDRIEERLQQNQTEIAMDKHVRNATRLLASSFAISSFLNFVIAIRVFTLIDPAISEAERQTILNEQIADMTWMGFAFIALPLMVFMIGVLWYLISGIQRYTGLQFEDIIHAGEHSSD